MPEMVRYQGPAMLRQNDQAIVVDADFEYLPDSQDDHAMNRLEGSFMCPLNLPGGQQITDGNAQIAPVEYPEGSIYPEPLMNSTLVKLSDKTEVADQQIWTVIDNAHEQGGFEVPEGVNLDG